MKHGEIIRKRMPIDETNLKEKIKEAREKGNYTKGIVLADLAKKKEQVRKRSIDTGEGYSKTQYAERSKKVKRIKK